MPSSRGRYQSRILSFLSQQSMQWRDRTMRTIRHSKLTVTIGVQMVLFPIYVLFQSGRLVGRQIRAAAKGFLPLLEAVKDDQFDPAVGVPPLDPDTPHRNVLNYLDSLGFPTLFDNEEATKTAFLHLPAGVDHHRLPTKTGESMISMEPAHLNHQVASGHLQIIGEEETSTQLYFTDSSPKSEYLELLPIIQGFASHLETQALVIVDIRNQILDILSLEQQQALSQRIIFEVACYYRKQNMRLNAKSQTLKLQSLSDDVKRGAWRFLPLPNQSSHTVAPVRLFNNLMRWMQRSAIASATNLFQETALIDNLTSSKALAPALTPELKVIHSFEPDSPTRPSFWRRIAQSLSLSTTSLGHAPSKSEPTDQWFDPDHQGATDGWFNSNQLTQIRRQTERFLVMPSLPFRNRWISWNEPIQGSDSIIDSPVQPIPVQPTLTTSELNGDTNLHKTVPPPDGQFGGIGQNQIDRCSTLTSEREKSAAGALDRVIEPNKDDKTLSPTLLETKAKFMGYEKHPLEQVLGWIDSGMLWLEDMAAFAWKWVRKILKLD